MPAAMSKPFTARKMHANQGINAKLTDVTVIERGSKIVEMRTALLRVLTLSSLIRMVALVKSLGHIVQGEISSAPMNT
jgi:hypothetical protein